MAYSPTTWVNGSTPALNATNLNKIEAALAALDARVTALDSGFPEPPPLYGPAVAMDVLGNKHVGGAGLADLSYRFRAEQTDDIVSVRVYWIDESVGGYGAGDGGTVRISVQADDGTGVPDGTNIASSYYDVVGPVIGLHTYTFTTPIPVTVDTLYHVVFDNVAADQANNYVSLDSIYQRVVTAPRQPKWPDSDFAMLRTSSTDPWNLQAQYTPILVLTYDGGETQGQSYMEVETTNTLDVEGTTDMVREVLTVSGGDKTVTGVRVRLAKTSGTGNVYIRLETSAEVEIATVTVPAADVQIPSAGLYGATFVGGAFPDPETLTNATTYHLRIYSDAGTLVWSRGFQQDTGGTSSTQFTDGYVQVTTNGGTNWNTVTGLSTLGDLQFYFTTDGT